MIETIILIGFLASLWLLSFFTSNARQAEFSPPYGDFRTTLRYDNKLQRRIMKFLACLSIGSYIVYELLIITVDSLSAVFIGS